MPVDFFFYIYICLSLLSMELDDSVLAEGSFRVDQTLSKQSPSITRHEPRRGERKEQRDKGLAKVRHGHQSTLANPRPPPSAAAAAAERAVSS